LALHRKNICKEKKAQKCGSSVSIKKQNYICPIKAKNFFWSNQMDQISMQKIERFAELSKPTI